MPSFFRLTCRLGKREDLPYAFNYHDTALFIAGLMFSVNESTTRRNPYTSVRFNR